MLANFVWLAQAPAGGGKGGGGGGFDPGLLLLFLGLGFLFYFMLIRPQQRERAKRDELLKGIKKNDRVLTIGGIYGIVTNIDTEADEVTIRVDESNNTKIRMTLSSIARPVREDASDEKSK